MSFDNENINITGRNMYGHNMCKVLMKETIDSHYLL